ncbi:hypothetical protein BST61_g3535 [Cercospora zeina]
MPGVPRSNACDACLKQKKKCDQNKPRCSRCERLRIPCAGAGVQRYKFFVVNGKRGSGATRLTVSHTTGPSNSITATPQNAATSLVMELVDKISIDDVRYDLCFTYGPILKEIPKRLGENAVLDASVSALMATMSDLATRRNTNERYKRFGNALSALRTSLQDPITAYSSMNLCAIFIIWICQGWVGGDQTRVSGHSAGVLKFLSRSPIRHSSDVFDRTVLVTMLGPVMFEAAYDPTLRLAPWMEEMLLGRQTETGMASSCLLQLTDMMKYDRGRLPSIELHYGAILAKCHEAEKKHSNLESLDYSSASQRLRSAIKAGCAINCGIAITLNGILLAYNPDDAGLYSASKWLHSQIVRMTAGAHQFFPLGAGWVPITLEFAWAAQKDLTRRATIEKLWEVEWYPCSDVPFGATPRFVEAFDKLRSDAASETQNNWQQTA